MVDDPGSRECGAVASYLKVAGGEPLPTILKMLRAFERRRRWVDQVGPVEQRSVAAVLESPIAGIRREDEIASTPGVEEASRMIQDRAPRLDAQPGCKGRIGWAIRRHEQAAIVIA